MAISISDSSSEPSADLPSADLPSADLNADPAISAEHQPTQVGMILKAKRDALGLTIDAVSTQTKVRSDYLCAIEDSVFDALPATSYAVGFVKIYAGLLGLDAQAMAAQFRSEMTSPDAVLRQSKVAIHPSHAGTLAAKKPPTVPAHVAHAKPAAFPVLGVVGLVGVCGFVVWVFIALATSTDDRLTGQRGLSAPIVAAAPVLPVANSEQSAAPNAENTISQAPANSIEGDKTATEMLTTPIVATDLELPVSAGADPSDQLIDAPAEPLPVESLPVETNSPIDADDRTAFVAERTPSENHDATASTPTVVRGGSVSSERPVDPASVLNDRRIIQIPKTVSPTIKPTTRAPQTAPVAQPDGKNTDTAPTSPVSTDPIIVNTVADHEAAIENVDLDLAPLAAELEFKSLRGLGEQTPDIDAEIALEIAEPIIAEATLVDSVAPNYPEQCRARARKSERVKVQFSLTALGEVQSPKIATSSNGCFDREALEAVAKFRYNPQLKDGQPIETPLKTVTIRFDR